VQSLKAGRAGIVVDVTINEKKLPMDRDTGAAVSLISEVTWKSLNPETTRDKSTMLLKTYKGEPLHIVCTYIIRTVWNEIKEIQV